LTRGRQKHKQNWKGINKKNHTFKDYKKKPLSKIDKTVSKRTFIDEIILKNTKKKYPLPGPGSHFLDEKLAKKWHSNKRDLFNVPKKEGNGKSNFSRSKRSFNTSKKGKSIPAPGYCQPSVTTY
jgi:hypothetical protein